MRRSAKTTGGRNVFRPTTPARPMQQFKADLIAVTGNTGSAVSDGNLVVFDNAFSDATDNADAVKLSNNGENFGVASANSSDNTTYVVEARKPISASSTVQYSMWNMTAGKYKLELKATDMDASTTTAILEDKYLGTKTPVSLSGDASTYSFTVTADAGSRAKDRFKVVFKKAASITVTEKSGYVVSPNPVEGATVNIRFSNQPKGRYNVRLISNSGQVISSKIIEHAGGNGNQLMSLPAGVASGSYQLEIIGADKKKQVQALFVDAVK